MKGLLKVIGGIVVVGVIILALFYFVVPNDQKKQIIQDLGIDESNPLVEEVAKAGYIEVEILTFRQNLNKTQWIINGLLRNTHPSKSMSTVELKFNFSDGSELSTVSGDLRPGRQFPVTFRRKIAGHSDAEFLDAVVNSAR